MRTERDREIECEDCLWNVIDPEDDYCALGESGPDASCFVPATEKEDEEDDKETNAVRVG